MTEMSHAPVNIDKCSSRGTKYSVRKKTCRADRTNFFLRLLIKGGKDSSTKLETKTVS